MASVEVRDGNVLVRYNDTISEDVAMLLRVSASLSGVGSSMNWRCEVSRLEADLLTKVAPRCAAVELAILPEVAAAPPPPTASIKDLVNAVHLRRRGLIKEILAQGVNVNAAHRRLFPLQMAIEKSNSKLTNDLLAAGANPNFRLVRTDNQTILMYAAGANNRNSSVVRSLLRASATLEARDKLGRTALMHAAQAGNSSSVQVLLERGASRDAVDNRGNTALNYAATHGTKHRVYTRLKHRPKQQPKEIVVVIPERS